ncbi:MAG: 3'-5' exonuclease [Thermotogae bacterium]|nr:3'-5' exonuclease [Thermotogota bacterium]
MRWAFLDIETTGTDFRRDRIVEIGIVLKGQRGRPRERVFLLNPKVPIQKRAYRVHGIGYDDVKGSPTFGEVKDEVLSLLRDAVIVGFNLLSLDIPFLNFELYRLGEPPLLNPMVDVRQIAKVIYEDAPNSLEKLARYLGLEVKGNHRALADARITRKVFQALRERKPEIFADVEGLESLTLSNFPAKSVDILRIAREYGWVHIKYYSHRYGLSEWDIRPITILKSYIIGDTGEGRFKYFNVMRIIKISPPQFGWI